MSQLIWANKLVSAKKSLDQISQKKSYGTGSITKTSSAQRNTNNKSLFYRNQTTGYAVVEGLSMTNGFTIQWNAEDKFYGAG